MYRITNCVSCDKNLNESSKFPSFGNDSLMRKCLINKLYQITGIPWILQYEDLTFLCLDCQSLLIAINTLEQKFVESLKVDKLKEVIKNIERDDYIDSKKIKDERIIEEVDMNLGDIESEEIIPRNTAKNLTDKPLDKFNSSSDDLNFSEYLKEIENQDDLFELSRIENNQETAEAMNINLGKTSEQKRRVRNYKTFECKLCLKSYKGQYSFVIHTRTHTGEKPFKCDICQHKFSDLSNYRRHYKRTHTEKKAFKCNICEQYFSQISDYQRHQNLQHGMNETSPSKNIS